MRKINGILLSSLFVLFSVCGNAAQAKEVKFEVEPGKFQISEDESVSIKMKVVVDGSASVSQPTYSAPGFEEINSFQGSYTQSVYENGRFGIKQRFEWTKVLRPMRSGALKISNIKINVDGSSYDAPDIDIRVTAGGVATPPPKQYSGGAGLRGVQKKGNRGHFFIKSEVNKNSVYKGEQIIVSYYIYQKGRVFNLEVTKFPTLEGCLKEELEVPIQQRGWQAVGENVILDGVQYRRYLLARYAAYPIKNGKLMIDSMELRGNYYAQAPNFFGNEDDLFGGFLRQLSPEVLRQKSEKQKVVVHDLPIENRPVDFTGGVGDFTIEARTNTNNVDVNKPLSVFVTVRGQGNIAAIGEPPVKWPDGVEVYEARSKTKTGTNGSAEKEFEFLIIPRKGGTIKLPVFSLSYFDPEKDKYLTKNTNAIELNVSGDTGSQKYETPLAPSDRRDMRKLKDEEPKVGIVDRWLTITDESGSRKSYLKYWWLGFLVLGIFVGIIFLVTLLVTWRKKRKYKFELAYAEEKKYRADWYNLINTAKKISSSDPNNVEGKRVFDAYEKLSNLLFEAIDQTYGVGARSYSREYLGNILVGEKGFNKEFWSKASEILEYSERVCFAGISNENTHEKACKEIETWVSECEGVCAEILSRKNEASISV